MNGIVKADDRLKARPKINIALFGQSGVGKTTQARTLVPERTLFVDLEAGTLAISGWAGDVFDVREFAKNIGAHPWEMTRALAVYIGGADPADRSGFYSQAVYDKVVEVFGDPRSMDKYDTVFIDSITVASRWCFSWAQTQPEAFSEKNGKPDTRGAYGLLGREMVRWLTHLQHSPKSIVVVGILDRVEDDLKRVSYSPQIEGGKTGREINGIFDQVMTIDYLYDDLGKPVVTADGKKQRCIYCTQDNKFNFPAKDRSGRLDSIEPPDIAYLMNKIHNGPRLDEKIITTIQTPTVSNDQ
jgi:hypothetical protein